MLHFISSLGSCGVPVVDILIANVKLVDVKRIWPYNIKRHTSSFDSPSDGSVPSCFVPRMASVVCNTIFPLSMALICRKMYFCAGPDVYQEIGDWQSADSRENIRDESDIAFSFIRCLATLTDVSSSQV